MDWCMVKDVMDIVGLCLREAFTWFCIISFVVITLGSISYIVWGLITKDGEEEITGFCYVWVVVWGAVFTIAGSFALYDHAVEQCNQQTTCVEEVISDK